MPATGPNGTYTPEQTNKLNTLFGVRHEIQLAIIAYSFADSMDLSSSAAVKRS